MQGGVALIPARHLSLRGVSKTQPPMLPPACCPPLHLPQLWGRWGREQDHGREDGARSTSLGQSSSQQAGRGGPQVALSGQAQQDAALPTPRCTWGTGTVKWLVITFSEQVPAGQPAAVCMRHLVRTAAPGCDSFRSFLIK